MPQKLLFHISFLLLLLPCLLVAQSGQTIKVDATILDGVSNQPLSGATAQVNGSDLGTTSDDQGRLELYGVEIGSTVMFSFVGYQAEEVRIEKAEPLTVLLFPEDEMLEEFVAVGYGKQRKKLATGAISQITAKNIEGYAVPDVQSAIEGQMAGIIVNESSGQPGASKILLIRGISTNGDNSPLYVVDGLFLDNIDNISPSDIESVDILKDAASCAIYGARGANGVVIITTKKGKKGKRGMLSYEGQVSVSEPWKLPEMMSADDYITITREKYANANSLSALESLGFPSSADGLANTNWMDEIFNPAMIQSHTLSATAPNAFMSLGYWDQNGVIGGEKSRYKRYSLRMNSTKEINKFLTVGENFSIIRTENPLLGDNNAFGSVISDAFAYDPITAVYDDSMDFGFAQSQWVQKEYINPQSRIFLPNDNSHADQIQGNVYLDVKPLKGLTLRSNVGIDYAWYRYRLFVPAYNFHPSAVNVDNDISQGSGFGQGLQFENYATYDRDLGEDHHMELVLGTTYYSRTGGGRIDASSSFIPEEVQFNSNFQFLNAGVDSMDLAGGIGYVDYYLLSYFGRAKYDFKEKYLFTATLRRDGSSNFGANNRWGMFPSFSAGWVLSKENFFNVPAISYLKLKGSWGVNGSDRIAPLGFEATIENVFTYAFGQTSNLAIGSALATPPNPDLKWEESVQTDLGVELELFDGEVDLSIDLYRKTTKDLLMERFIPGFVGATNNPISNQGEIRNQGIEMALGRKQVVGDFTFTSRLTYTHFKNTVIEVAGETGYLQGWSWPVRNTPITRMTEGFPVGHFVGYMADGIFQSDAEVFSHINSEGDLLQPNAAPGDIRFLDVNEDGVIDSEDITNIGSPWPDHIIGLNLNVKWKGFDLSTVLSTQIGHDIYRTYERSDVTFSNYQTFWLDRWTPENPSAEYPRLVFGDPNNNQRPSSFYVEDGTFFRLRNLQIGYSLPKDIVEKMKLQGLRIFFTGNNLFTSTTYRGFDPDIGTNGWILDTGIDKGFYPSNRTIGGGMKLTF